MCFKKPVVQVTFKEASYSLPFDQSNVIVQSTLEKLSEKILEIINDQNFQNKIIENNSNFIQEFYNIPEKDVASQLDQLIKDL